MKRYFVLCTGKIFGFKINTNSLKTANWLMNLNWEYAKIHDRETNLCIAINNKKAESHF